MDATGNNDWYEFLRLSPAAADGEIHDAVERLSRQAAALAATAPERSQSLRETIRSIKRDLLSGPENRQRYDALRLQRLAPPRLAAPRLAPPPVPAPAGPASPAPRPDAPIPVPSEPVPYPGQGAGSRLARFLRTGWTCPACGKGGVPSDKFCTKCGTPIQAIRPETLEPRGAPRTRATCATCAYPLGPTDAFCSKCGSRR